MKKSLFLLGKLVASFAFLVTFTTMNSACIFLSYQEKLPEEASKLCKY